LLITLARILFFVHKTPLFSEYQRFTSHILGDLIQRAIDSPHDPNADASLPVVQLPESGEILHRLLTFIFPVTPLVSSAHEDIMELLSVAQKHQMGTTLTHILKSVTQQNSLPTSLEPLLHIYALAQKYGLWPEALQAARAIFLKYLMTTFEDFNNKLDIMPGASLYELLKYHERVRAILTLDLTELGEITVEVLGPFRGRFESVSAFVSSPFLSLEVSKTGKNERKRESVFDSVFGLCQRCLNRGAYALAWSSHDM
jgi:hypothetical protein